MLVVILFFGAILEPVRLSVTTIRLDEGRLTRLLAGRKVALLSDLHFGKKGEPIAEAVLQQLKIIRPDLILLTGDYVDWGSRSNAAYDNALSFLAKLQAPLGVFGVLGDADRIFSRRSCDFCHLPGSGAPAERHSVVFLKNAQTRIDTPQGGLVVIGIDPEHGSRQIPPQIRQFLETDMPVVMLSHTSEIYETINGASEVMVLAGDTHGGQVSLPNWLWRLSRLMPDPSHVYGVFHEGKKTLIVTRGLGTTRIRFRLGAPPEIMVLEFSERENPRRPPSRSRRAVGPEASESPRVGK